MICGIRAARGDIMERFINILSFIAHLETNRNTPDTGAKCYTKCFPAKSIKYILIKIEFNWHQNKSPSVLLLWIYAKSKDTLWMALRMHQKYKNPLKMVKELS